MGRKGIYLREQGEYVGPFCSLADAEDFLHLMDFFGESCEGIEIVVEDADRVLGHAAVTSQEKRRLLAKRGRGKGPMPPLNLGAGEPRDRAGGERLRPRSTRTRKPPQEPQRPSKASSRDRHRK